MKKYLSILFSFIFIGNACAQWVTIPDTGFVNFLTSQYPACMNGNQMDTTCNSIVSAMTVDCSNLGIADLDGIQYFDNLDVLWCNNNQLISLPRLPDLLTYLYCGSNQISTLPSLPASLIQLSCSLNVITSLPPLPNTLLYLVCPDNQLTSLPTLPSSLRTILAKHNQLSSLPTLPAGMVIIDCEFNLLSTLPTLPSTLTYLHCANNMLSSLPVLPGTLGTLNCNNNQLTSLPALPGTLTDLTCSFNQLTSLPALPGTISFLACDNNLLSTIPALPNVMEALYCYLNQITSLPELPDSIATLGVQDNPNLTCLPQLKVISVLNFTNTAIQCIPNYGSVTTSFPALNSLPLCDAFNTNGCEAFWNISGKVYSDLNGNCIDELIEPGLERIKIELFNGGVLQQQVYSISGGLYSFDTDTGNFTYSVDTSGLPILVTCPPSGFHSSAITSADSVDLNMNFGLACKPGFDVGVLTIIRNSGRFFPGNNATVKIDAGDMSAFYGLNCAVSVSGSVTVQMNGPVSFISPSPGALIPLVSGNTLTYTINDFALVNVDSAFSFIVSTDTLAQSGDTICFEVTVSPVAGDINPGNNTLLICFNVVNSFDPNAKEVYPSAEIHPNQEWLTYTVYFQNTGTAAAQNIYILDTLDQNVVPGTFSLLTSSHDLNTIVSGNIVRFNFHNINLPDSSNDEPGSHGYVQYKIKPAQGLALGTQISNLANIYFDFNPPIATNTVINTVSNLISVPEITSLIDFSVFPNPTSGEARISFNLEKSAEVGVEIYNTLGEKVKLISEQRYNSGKNYILFSTNELSRGIYYISFVVDGIASNGKIVKM